MLLPGVTTLARLVASVRETANERLWSTLTGLLTTSQRGVLDALVAVPAGARVSELDRLRRGPVRVSGPATWTPPWPSCAPTDSTSATKTSPACPRSSATTSTCSDATPSAFPNCATHVHHTAEDDALWPTLRASLAGRPDDLALLEAMEAEHAAVDEVVAAVDAVLADPPVGLDRLGDLTDSLVIGLTGHLKHEEDAALPLVQATATAEQWASFGMVHAQRIGPDAPRLLPWLLDGAAQPTVAAMLAPLPEPARLAYREQWRPAYQELDRWQTGATA